MAAEFVKVLIEDGEGRRLLHHYLRIDSWDLPAGRIEEGETPRQAAARELLERTGYRVAEASLEAAGEEAGFSIFRGRKESLAQVAAPGELGGYSTEVRWG